MWLHPYIGVSVTLGALLTSLSPADFGNKSVYFLGLV